VNVPRPPKGLAAPTIGVAALLYYAGMDTMGSPLYAINSVFPEGADVVHDLWFAALVGFCFLIAVGFKTLAVPVWLLFASANGTEDLLFYIIQGRFPPYSVAYLQGPFMWPQPATELTLLFGLSLSIISLPLLLGAERKLKLKFF